MNPDQAVSNVGFTDEQVLDLLNKLDAVITNQATIIDNMLMLNSLLIMLFAVIFLILMCRLGVFRWLKR